MWKLPIISLEFKAGTVFAVPLVTMCRGAGMGNKTNAAKRDALKILSMADTSSLRMGQGH
jgi:hypothetical protein